MKKPEQPIIISRHGAVHGTYKSYITGFVLSLILTLSAYFLVTEHLLSGWALLFAIFSLAITQLLVQLIFFLHLARESKPRWNLVVFLFMTLVLLIVVFGSLWIMNNLNYHTMTPEQTNTYIEHEELINKEPY